MKTLASKLMNAGRKIAIGASLLGALAGCGELERQACLSNNFRDFEKPKGEIAEVLDCSKSEKADPYVNQIPTASLGMDFGDGLSGKVTYLVAGTDSDGTITEARARFNGGAWEIYSNGTSFQKDIAPGANSLEAYAVDDKGAQSLIVTREFVSPTEAEARERIDSELQKRGYVENFSGTPGTFYKDALFSTGYGNLTGDYLLFRSNGAASVIEYVSDTDNLTIKLNEKGMLDQGGNPNRYFLKLPLNEVIRRFNTWADNGFQ